MANTIKFGNGQWATKEDSILAYNDENANFKPLPFVTSRASTATRVNKAGLLETVASGVPRVDYLGNSKGSYLLEPSSTNLITQSEAFGNTYWTKSGASIEGDASTAGVEKVVNGNFATNSSNWTGWTWTSGEMKSPNSGSFLTQTGILTSGKFYKVTFEAYADSATTLRFYLSSGDIDVPITTTKTTFTRYAESTGDFIRFVNVLGVVTYIDNVSVKEVQGFSAPSVDSPLGAFKLVEGTADEEHKAKSDNSFSYANCSFSVYAKYIGNSRNIKLSLGTGKYASFNLQTGIAFDINSNTVAKIDSLTDGWYRCSIVGAISSSKINVIILNDEDDSYQGDGTSGVYIFGAQLEQQSYATSYIPTKGSQISRLSETASQTVPDGIINSSEGVLFAEISGFGNDAISRAISISDGTTSNRINLFLPSSQTQVVGRVSSEGVTVADMIYTGITQTSYNKIAVKWKVNDFALWVNGVEVLTHSSGTVPTGLSQVSFDNASSALFLGNCKDLRVFSTALTDSELQTLTTI